MLIADMLNLRIAGMLRVKNESRWIGEVLDSLETLCTCIYVLDDHSDDDTAEIARRHGAVVLDNPFDGFDETRDNQYLLDAIMDAVNPDWIIRLDGDEVMERGAAALVYRAIVSGVAQCYSLPCFFLWDTPDQIRIDRWYSQRVIPCVFRAARLVYPETVFGGNEAKNIHCPRVPGGLELKAVQCGARILHYGYMDRLDRIRKYRFYNRIDPANEYEDHYRHIVQGDIADVPADAILKWAGPLELAPLPRSIQPDTKAMPMFSIIHPAARPDKWLEIYKAWKNAAASPDQVDYVLVVDKRWGFAELPSSPIPEHGFRAVWNTGRRCYVDAVNIGAHYSTGDVLIVIADDQYPCDGWDLKLAEALGDSGKEVVEVSTGTPEEHAREILVMPILTRARYERLGFVLFPGFESMYADNDFCDMAKQEDQIADARCLMFPHRHPIVDSSVPSDAVYEAQNRPEAYQLGAELFNQRRAERSKLHQPVSRKRIVLCLLGQTFSNRWVSSLLRTLAWLNQHFIVQVVMGYSSNVYATRHRTAMVAIEDQADYVLWMDDDNCVEPADVAQLIDDLEAVKDIDVVAGWCFAEPDSYESPVHMTSVGMFVDGNQVALTERDLMTAKALVKIDWTGFPLVLMRQSVLRQFQKPFAPIEDDSSEFGFLSEDLSFSKRLMNAQINMAVDPRVKVPHLKLRDANILFDSPATAGISKGEN